MKALRELTVEQSKFYSAPFITELSLLGYAVREYHGSYYVPHNLTLIVAGKLASGTSTLLDVVQDKIEPSLIAHGQNHGPRPKGWKKPFLETPSANRPPFTQTIRDTVEFPEQDESVGEVQISWQGPAPTDFQENKVRTALLIVLIYLIHSLLGN